MHPILGWIIRWALDRLDRAIDWALDRSVRAIDWALDIRAIRWTLGYAIRQSIKAWKRLVNYGLEKKMLKYGLVILWVCFSVLGCYFMPLEHPSNFILVLSFLLIALCAFLLKHWEFKLPALTCSTLLMDLALVLFFVILLMCIAFASLFANISYSLILSPFCLLCATVIDFLIHAGNLDHLGKDMQKDAGDWLGDLIRNAAPRPMKI